MAHGGSNGHYLFYGRAWRDADAGPSFTAQGSLHITSSVTRLKYVNWTFIGPSRPAVLPAFMGAYAICRGPAFYYWPMGHYIAHDHTITKENESEDKDLDENPILLSRSLGLSCDRVIELEDTPAQDSPDQAHQLD